MKCLVVGDAPTVSTGFSRCTLALCEALIAARHQPLVLGISHFGRSHNFPFTIEPCIEPLDGGTDLFGSSRLPLMIDRFKPDVVVLINDPWNYRGYEVVLDSYFKDSPSEIPPIVLWAAVDSRNQQSAKQLNRLAHIAVWTQFGFNELRAGGYEGPMSIVPLGVDHALFYPCDKAESRQKIQLPKDAFVVGLVGRNQGRKRIDIALEAFAKWANYDQVLLPKPPEPVLYLHVAPTGDHGCDIESLARYYGIADKVYLRQPRVGVGDENELMPFVYSAMDVYLSTSQAEGWLLPATEAMACGVPCIVPDFAATGPDGWVGDAALRVRCSSSALTAPMNTRPYTIGAVPDVEEVVDALWVMSQGEDREAYRVRGMMKSAEFSWQRTGQEMVKVLEGVL